MQCTALCFMFSSQVINKKLAKHLKEMKLFLVLRNLNKYIQGVENMESACVLVMIEMNDTYLLANTKLG